MDRRETLRITFDTVTGERTVRRISMKDAFRSTIIEGLMKCPEDASSGEKNVPEFVQGIISTLRNLDELYPE